MNSFLQILVRINGGKLKHNDELRLELTDGLNLKSVIKQAMKKLAKNDNYSVAKLYNKNGVMLFENDFSLIGHGDIVYLAPKGKLEFYSYLFIQARISTSAQYWTIMN